MNKKFILIALFVGLLSCVSLSVYADWFPTGYSRDWDDYRYGMTEFLDQNGTELSVSGKEITNATDLETAGWTDVAGVTTGTYVNVTTNGLDVLEGGLSPYIIATGANSRFYFTETTQTTDVISGSIFFNDSSANIDGDFLWNARQVSAGNWNIMTAEDGGATWNFCPAKVATSRTAGNNSIHNLTYNINVSAGSMKQAVWFDGIYICSYSHAFGEVVQIGFGGDASGDEFMPAVIMHWNGTIDELPAGPPTPPDTQGPNITWINCTSCRINQTYSNTTDTTNTWNVTLDGSGYCAITTNCSSGLGNVNFTVMNVSGRSCWDDAVSSGFCTVTAQDVLTVREGCGEFISCIDTSGNQLESGSLSGAMPMYVDSGYQNWIVSYSRVRVLQNQSLTATVTAVCGSENVINCSDPTFIDPIRIKLDELFGNEK